jgi:peptide deformylase
MSDLPVAQDLRDTLDAHQDGCVGMAANMIGVAKRIIIFDDNGSAKAIIMVVENAVLRDHVGAIRVYGHTIEQLLSQKHQSDGEVFQKEE